MMSDVLKKRKALHGEGGTPPEMKRSRHGDQQQQDVVRSTYSEEAELDGRNPERDRLQYKQTCESLAKLMGEIQELRANGAAEEDGGGSSAEAERKRMQSCVHFMTLKRLNRLAHLRLKRARDQTHDTKQKVDVLHLQLQNLLYQVMHWQKAIGKCLEFKSEHDDIDLVSETDFYEEAPSAISRPDVTRGDPHQLALARLNWELEQRKRLAEKYTESQATRENTRKSIEVKKEHLSSLKPGLNAIRQASVPVQEYLSVPSCSSERSPRQTEKARHLPASLYVLFVQASAYGQACDTELCVSIAGDVEEAKALSKCPEVCQADESHSDAEELDKTKRRRPTTGGQLDDKRREMLRRHPLSICLDIKCKDGSVLHLYFCYLTNLNIMTVKSKVSTELASTAVVSAGELLKPGTLLDCLLAGDQSRETPNPANRYQLDNVGIALFADYAEELGRPYLWVQKLGGLQFPGDAPEEGGGGGVGGSLSASHMESTVKLLRERVESRLVLYRQFASLENGVVPVWRVWRQTECRHISPGKIISRLTSWTAISYREYRDLAFTRHVTDGGLATETDMHFVAVVERGAARLRAAVALSPRYPAVSPLFSLSLSWKGEERSGSTDDNLRAAESQVNDTLKSELQQGNRPGPQLLTTQVAHLCVWLDACLEADVERPGEDQGTCSASVEPDTDVNGRSLDT